MTASAMKPPARSARADSSISRATNGSPCSNSSMSAMTFSLVSTWTLLAQRYSALFSSGLLGSKTLSTAMLIERIVARDCSSASRVGTELGFALGVAFGSCAQATGVAASSALTVPQRSSREIAPIAAQRSGASAKLVCTATQLRRPAADELRQRDGTAVGIDDEPLMEVIERQAGRRAAQLAGREPKLRARRPGDGLVGREVLLADDRSADGEPRDQVRHQS